MEATTTKMKLKKGDQIVVIAGKEKGKTGTVTKVSPATNRVVVAGLNMIKGGAGALTREKIVAAVAREFVCICDGSKLVDVMGKFPLPVEVIPMSRAHVDRELAKLGGTPVLREGFVTDNGNLILDVKGLAITDPKGLEAQINQITGVVTNGLFAVRPANLLLLGTADGVKTIS